MDDFDFDPEDLLGDDDSEEPRNPIYDEIERQIIENGEPDDAPSVKVGEEYEILCPPGIYSISLVNSELNNALIKDGKIKIKIVRLFANGLKQQVLFLVYDNNNHQYIGVNREANDDAPFQAPAKTARILGIGINQLAMHGTKISKGGRRKRTYKNKKTKRKHRRSKKYNRKYK